MFGSFKRKYERAQAEIENAKYDIKCGKKGSRYSLPASNELP
jgi:hypothetical protein